MRKQRGGGWILGAARVVALAAAFGGVTSSCTCGSSAEGPSKPNPTASGAPSAAPTAKASGAEETPSPSPSATADSGAFVRQRPEERQSADACAYLGFGGFDCLDALLAENDPVVRRYMRRLSDADARLSKDAYTRGEAPGIPHAEMSVTCADRGPCGQKDANGNTLDDGYACLTKAQLLTFQGDALDAVEAHKRACRCGADRAQIPIMGGFLACDGPSKPVERGGNLTLSEAQNIRACAECDHSKGAAACARELAALKPADPELARYIETIHIPRCQKP